MNLDTIQITEEEATARVAEYEKMRADERTIEDQAIMLAYNAARRGLPIISLTTAFRVAGRFPNRDGVPDAGLPRLAIARANAMNVRCRPESGGGWRFVDDVRHAGRDALVGKHHVLVRVEGVTWQAPSGVSVVPTIPPRHRPRPRRLAGFHILWEVEKWNEVPTDPALIRHIRGDLWSVVATWDLTQIERLVLSQRR